MNVVEIILIVFIGGLGLMGFAMGLIQAVGSIVGIVVGSVVASRIFDSVGGFMLPLFGGNQVAAALTSFIIVFVATTKLVGFLFYLVNKAFNMVAIIPGLKLINRLGGLVLGVIEGALIIGVILNLTSRLPLSDKTAEMLTSSHLLASINNLTGWLVPLFPKVLQEATSVFR